jgi:prolyl 4-hydroxylase
LRASLDGVADAAIGVALDGLKPQGSALAGGKLPPPPLIRRSPPNLHKIESPSLTLYQYDDFLKQKDCERVIALISHHLQPSTLTRSEYDRDFRTSQTCLLAQLRSPVAVELDAKICKTLGIRAAYGEGIQAQRYDVGQQFKPNYDWFPPGSDEYRRFAALRGNRTWTNPAARHSGEPVLSGHKIIITKWFRVAGTGPVFFE